MKSLDTYIDKLKCASCKDEVALIKDEVSLKLLSSDIVFSPSDQSIFITMCDEIDHKLNQVDSNQTEYLDIPSFLWN